MAGSNLGLKNPNEVYVAMLRTRTVEDAMIRRFGLQKQYHKARLSDARKAFEKHSSIEGNGKDTLIRISVEAPDPNRAAEVVNAYVEEFRSLTQHLAITEASQRRLFLEQQLLATKNNLADAEQALKITEIGICLTQVTATCSVFGSWKIIREICLSWRHASRPKHRAESIWHNCVGRKAFAVRNAVAARRGLCAACCWSARPAARRLR